MQSSIPVLELVQAKYLLLIRTAIQLSEEFNRLFRWIFPKDPHNRIPPCIYQALT